MSASYLEKMQKGFSASLSSASSKLSNKKTLGAGTASGATLGSPALAPPSPSPSIGSTTSRNDPTPSGTKRKRQDVVYSQPEATGWGNEIGTNLVYALTYLRDKAQETKTSHDVLGHLSLLTKDDAFKENFVHHLRNHPRVDHRPTEGVTEQKWHHGTYRYRPIIANVRDKEGLLKFLQERKDSSGVQVKDLKDGWAECEPALQELENQHKILVIRTKKESNPKHVFLDDPELGHVLDAEFRNMWMRVAVPKVDELPRKLSAVGQKPTSADPTLAGPKVPIKQKQQKKRAARKMGRVTNTHMQDILKDFSGVKK